MRDVEEHNFQVFKHDYWVLFGVKLMVWGYIESKKCQIEHKKEHQLRATDRNHMSRYMNQWRAPQVFAGDHWDKAVGELGGFPGCISVHQKSKEVLYVLQVSIYHHSFSSPKSERVISSELTSRVGCCSQMYNLLCRKHMQFSFEWGNTLTRLHSIIQIHLLFSSPAMAGAGTNSLGLGH